jgi:hypothetical protein
MSVCGLIGINWRINIGKAILEKFSGSKKEKKGIFGFF